MRSLFDWWLGSKLSEGGAAGGPCGLGRLIMLFRIRVPLFQVLKLVVLLGLLFVVSEAESGEPPVEFD